MILFSEFFQRLSLVEQLLEELQITLQIMQKREHQRLKSLNCWIESLLLTLIQQKEKLG